MSPSTLIALMSFTLSVGTLAACISTRRHRLRAEAAARQARAHRIQAELSAERARKALDGMRVPSAKLVSIGEHGCGLTLPSPKGSRPTHPDGSPYRYHEIVAEGWGHCDACRQWGQWTAENPHECAQPAQVRTEVTVRGWGEADLIGAEITRSLRGQRRDGGI